MDQEKDKIYEAMIGVEAALQYAVEKHPSWDAYSFAEMACIIAEESGEVAKAVNDFMDMMEKLEQDTDPEAHKNYDVYRFFMGIKNEVQQLAAVSMRMLLELDKRWTEAEETHGNYNDLDGNVDTGSDTGVAG